MRKFLRFFAITGALLTAAIPALSAAQAATTAGSAATPAASEPASAPLKTAIFVNNLGGELLASEVPVLEAAIAADLNGRGFSVLSPQEIAESIRKSGNGEQDLGHQLASESSARALARTLGADYLLVAHLLSFNKRQVQYAGNGIATVNERYRLRVAYSLLESGQGGGLEGETFVIESVQRDSGNLRIRDGGLISDLVAEAAQKIAGSAVAKAESGRIAAASQNVQEVTFTVSAQLQGIALPNVNITEDGQAELSAQTFPVEAMGATVELDGVAIGSAPGTFSASPGLHQMRITRPGFQTWSRNVNLREGFHLVAALEFTPEGLAQWKQMSQFMQDLKDKAKLSDAKAELVRGAAQLLRQSGYRVDTKEAPATIIQNGSIWEPVIPVRPRTIQGPGPVIIQQGSTDAAALQPAAAATSAATAAEQTLLIQIDAEGKLRHGTEALNIEELPALIKTAQTAAAQGGRSLRVHLLASPQASYGAIAPVIEALKKQGVTNLELLSDASVQPAAKAPAVTVSLKGDGLVYWNGKAVSEDALDKQFADAAAAGVREITLQAAPSIPLRRTMPIVDKAKANHISVRFEELR